MPLRRGPLRADQPAVRLRLLPLPHLPADQRRAGDGVRERSRRAPRMDAGRRSGEVGSLLQLRASEFLRRMRDAFPDEGRSPARDRRFQRRNARRSRSRGARLPHLLGQPDRLVRAQGRAAAPREVPAPIRAASTGPSRPAEHQGRDCGCWLSVSMPSSINGRQLASFGLWARIRFQIVIALARSPERARARP